MKFQEISDRDVKAIREGRAAMKRLAARGTRLLRKHRRLIAETGDAWTKHAMHTYRFLDELHNLQLIARDENELCLFLTSEKRLK